jgi:hypothetical protein
MINYSLCVAVFSSMALSRFRSLFGNVTAIIVFGIFLIFSPDTGSDYFFYKEGYEGITYSNAFPFVFGVEVLTVDQGFLWYMGIFRLITESYGMFLCLNFFLLMYLFNYVLKSFYGFARADIADLIFLAMPVIIPVAFYWSPRSAPSLLVMTALCSTLYSRRYLYSFALALMAAVLHSQYIPNVLGLIIYYCLAGAVAGMVGLIFIALLSSLLVAMPLFYGDIAVNFASLFDGKIKTIFLVAVDKLHYFTDGSLDGQIRYSYALMFLLEIFLLYSLVVKRNDKEVRADRVILLLIFSVVFSIVVNILFMGSAHLAGRVARYSDWIVATVGVLYLINKIHTKRLSRVGLNLVGISSVIGYFYSVYYIQE